MMEPKWRFYLVFVLVGYFFKGGFAEKTCPMPKIILPCRCLMRGDEYQVWCTHSDLSSVLEGLRAAAKYIKDPIDELILENNYLPSLPGRTFFKLKVMRIMLRHNGMERVSNDWLGGLETTLMELFVVEPKLRTIPDDSLQRMIALQAVTVQSNSLKRLPIFSGLPKLRYLQLESTALMEISERNFKNNPSLEKIFIGQCPHLDRLDANLFVDLPSLIILNISYCGIKWLHHRAFMGLPLLQELVIVGNRIQDAGMVGHAIRELPQLTVLRLDNNFIDQLGEAAFVDLPTLQSLHLSNNRIIELQHGAFHRVPRLKQLHLDGNFLRRIHPEGFLQESGSGLEELWLVQNEINHVADLRAILDALPRLIFLDMSYNQLEAIPFGALRGHPTLEQFYLDHNRIHLIDREAFGEMPALRELRLKNNSLSDALLQPPLWTLPELKGLDLAHNYFRKLELTFFENLPSLRKLDLNNNEIMFIDPSTFTITPNLERINLSYNALSTLHPAIFRPLQHLYELDVSNNILLEFVPGLPRGIEYLHLQNNDIPMFPLAPTPDLDLPALKMLDLTYNKIEAMPKDGLKSLPHLRKLFMRKNRLKKLEDGCLRGLQRLEIVDLSENALAYLSSKVFMDQTELRELNLGSNLLDHLEPEVLQFVIKLKRLNLTNNMLTDLVEMDRNQDLQALDVSHNRLDSIETLQWLKNLRYLNLAFNRLTTMNSEVLSSLPSLKSLKLSNNMINQLKVNAINKLDHLDSLDLNDNQLKILQPDAINSLPVLKSINLSRNKIEVIPNMVFVNLPSLQTVELQENMIRSIGQNAFVGVPDLLSFNLSHNQLNSFDNAGLAGVKSLELLDVSHNQIKTAASSSLAKMEWMVELRIDNNKICGVQASPFNNMPRLRVVTLRNNELMSFPQRAIDRIRGNLAILDIDGNPLSCQCNMIWMQVWLSESNTNNNNGPRCSNGYFLRDLDLQNCPTEERNVELVAPGCEGELLVAPGVLKPGMNLKSINNSSIDQNGLLAPSPEQSDLFNEHYVEVNDTTESDVVPDTFYAGHPKANKPLNASNSQISYPFPFPITQFAKVVSNAIKNAFGNEGRRNSPPPTVMDDRMAIVNNNNKKMLPTKPIIESGKKRLNTLIDTPTYLGGFNPIVIPGDRDFKPMLNLSTTETEELTTFVPIISTTPPKTSGLVGSFIQQPLEAVTIFATTFGNYDDAIDPTMNGKRSSNEKRKYYDTTSTTMLKHRFFNRSEETSTIVNTIDTTELMFESTTPKELSASSHQRPPTLAVATFLIPDRLQKPSRKTMAYIEKVPSASASLRAEDDGGSREAKKIPMIVTTDEVAHDMSWYYENYFNNTAQSGALTTIRFNFIMVVVMIIFRVRFLC